eukprot:1160411-Pelagomonas_calceolata.AAC.1
MVSRPWRHDGIIKSWLWRFNRNHDERMLEVLQFLMHVHVFVCIVYRRARDTAYVIILPVRARAR